MADPLVPPFDFEEYRVIRSIGKGGMGQVFLAHDTLLDRPVAVKFIATARPDPSLRAQFFAEARALARLQHPNVVAVFRVGEARRHPYLVSEYVHGRTLADLERPLSPGRVLPIAIGLARGLAAAHRRFVLHRDIKASNAIVTDEGDAKLVDFGLAQLFEPDGGVGRAREHGDGIVGTPQYIAPEIWRGEPATPAADIYSFGVLLFELLAGRAPHAEISVARLAQVVGVAPPPALSAAAPGIPAELAAIVDRCLDATPARRYPSADALREALEQLVERPPSRLPAGNPYRGLACFEAEHRGLFFGRDVDVRAIVDRLRAEPWILVAGDSGIGKSSLCLAGVLPVVADEGKWRLARLVPGRHPLLALAAAIAPVLGLDEGDLAGQLRREPGTVAARVARAGPVLVFVDQLEELFTLAAPAEADAFAAAWATFGVVRPGLRALATIRGDFLTRLAGLESLQGEVARALHLVPPLGPAGVRAAIVEPATCKGVGFESEALVETLAASVVRGPGGLPLLQFALAALWDARDPARGVLTSAALATLGGVDGALARHGDAVVTRLRPAERMAARRLLTRLVNPDGTRARYRQEELLENQPAEAHTALEALVHGRLLVARESDDGEDERSGHGSYEIAHEALVEQWGSLRSWLAESLEARAAGARLARAASEWTRLGRREDGLLSRRQLAELDQVATLELGALEAELVRASRAALRGRARRRWLGGLGVAATAAAVLLTWRVETRRALDAAVAARAGDAARALEAGEALAAKVQAGRERAFALFQAGTQPAAESVWREALLLARARDEAFGRAEAALEGALGLDPARRDLRRRMVDLLYRRVVAAEVEHRPHDREELVARLRVHDVEGERAGRLVAPARVSLASRPTGARVSLASFTASNGKHVLGPIRALGVAPLTAAIDPGAHVLLMQAAGRAEARLPLVVAREAPLDLDVDLPPAAQVPAGYVYVPAGRFLFGSADDEGVRDFLQASPLREVATGGYLIGRTEVTFADWIAFLEELPSVERERRRPRGAQRAQWIELKPSGTGWRLEMGRGSGVSQRASDGEPFRYEARQNRRSVQDWRQFPVAGVSYDDVLAYTAWLARTGRLPRARPCTEHEWERAARGADGRRLPGGDRADPDDMNHDRTYGRHRLAFGPDMVGSHPASRSPHGVDDLAGNVWEWVRSSTAAAEVVNRGGSWYQNELTSWSANREVAEPDLRHPFVGARVCADLPAPDLPSSALQPRVVAP